MISVALLPEGSVSDEAAHYLFGDSEVKWNHYKPIADVFLSTAGEKTDYSIIPIENTIEGSVSLHLDWLVNEVDLPIQAEWVYPSIQNLIGHRNELVNPDGTLASERIVKVLSHPVALAQCTQYLRNHLPHAELEQISSTVEAVRLVKENPDAGWAAIGTQSGARVHGLDVLCQGVTDHSNNYTRFLLVGSKPFEARTSDVRKTSVVIHLPEDYPGALHQVLSAFAWRRINLSKIESRPTKKRLGNYYFTIDIEMPIESVLLQSAISEIEAIGCQIRVLGSYPSFSYK
ncbi:prephenate dehydratase [Paenibacillus pinihumi]|uniref:prephenate dehydratase n=1 Tax=Paenibacillus pinihumi TaxID=669462 RepID=UPI000413C3A3|nr:prephenate dehydratase [Paenibacillus pinihumi]